MPTAASLNVLVKANTKNFTKGVRGITKQLGGLRTLFAGFSLGAGAFAFQRIASDIDSTVKTSRKLGVTISGLQGLRVAAQRTGVATNTLDMGLQRMVRRVSEAGRETGEAKDAIAELGLDARRLAALAPDKQFAAIADAMSRVSNQSDRVRLSFKLFDSEGVALVNTLRGGSSVLKQYAEEAQRLGVIFSEEQGKDVERFVDALDRLQTLLKGLGQRIVLQVGPGVADSIEGLLALVSGEAAGPRGRRGGSRLGGAVGTAQIAGSYIQNRVTRLYDRLLFGMQGAGAIRPGERMGAAAARALLGQPRQVVTPQQQIQNQVAKNRAEEKRFWRSTVQVWKGSNLVGRGIGQLTNFAGGNLSLPQLSLGKLGQWLVGQEFATKQPRAANASTGIGAAIKGTPEAMRAIFEATFGRDAKELEREKRDLLKEIRDALRGQEDRFDFDPVFG